MAESTDSFHNVRLPTDVERGALGGPRFKTTVLELESGFEQRNIDWSRVRGEWDIGYGLLLKVEESSFCTDLDELQNFFYARQGRAFSFRFKDFADFEIGDPTDSTTAAATAQSIGTGNGSQTVFQIFKRYTSGIFDTGSVPITYDKSINKIVAGSEFVFVNAVLQTSPGDYSLNDETGELTFTSAVPDTEDVSIACLYDNHVRFDTDQLSLNMEVFNAGSWPNIPIVEVRGTGVA